MSILDSTLRILTTTIPPLLTFELLLGGQARITPLLTPSLYEKALKRKALGMRDALYPLVPIRDPVRHSNFIRVLMLIAGGLVARRETRAWGAGLTLVLAGMGIYSQRRMKMPYWLPVVNSLLALAMLALERRRDM